MSGERYSRRSFVLLAGAGASGSALLYWTRQSMQAHRAGVRAANTGVAPWIDSDGWMLAADDGLRTRVDDHPDGTVR